MKYFFKVKGAHQQWYYCHTEWVGQTEVNVVLKDNVELRAWKFTINEDNVNEMKNLSKNENFEALLEKAFKEPGESFVFEMEGDVLKWRIVDEINLVLGTLSVSPMEFKDADNQFCNSSIEEVKALRDQLEIQIQEMESLKGLNKKCTDALEKCVEEKETIEQRLFAEFLPILNSKKAKIRELLGLEKLEESEGEDHPPSAVHTMSESDEEADQSSVSILTPGKRSQSVDSQNFLDLSSFNE